MTETEKSKIQEFQRILWEENRHQNLVSRRMTTKQLEGLIEDSLAVFPHISSRVVVDMGSGNGILGIPLAVKGEKKTFFLVDSNGKKTRFLKKAKKTMGLHQVKVIQKDIMGFIRDTATPPFTLVSRGYTGKNIVPRILEMGATEVIFITSLKKFSQLKKGINEDKIRITLHDLKGRDRIKIFKMESVSRETGTKKM